ncbi:MAG: hypothetical protein Q8R24_02335 [Legionellaceae bacterium]|nr:hypothetical protein [Legionellaceae bacterium]
MKKLGFIVMAAGLLTSCSVFNPTDYASSNKEQYLKSTNGAQLVVPPPLTTSNISDFYSLPAQNQNAKVSITPPVE